MNAVPWSVPSVSQPCHGHQLCLLNQDPLQHDLLRRQLPHPTSSTRTYIPSIILISDSCTVCASRLILAIFPFKKPLPRSQLPPQTSLC